MTLAVLVVDGDAAVQQRRHAGRIERRVEIDVEQGLDLVEQEAAVAVGAGDQRCAGVVGQRAAAADLGLGAPDQGFQRLLVEPAEDQHLAARQQARR